MTTAEAIEALGRAAATMIDAAVEQLVPAGRTRVSTSWGSMAGQTTLTVLLDDGQIILGRGPAKLEAITDAALHCLVR